ncbi:MAG: DUF4358 domain-containing protein [Ruminococcus sp.]|nr:DUF4358 domain-containing protein [Ruminococcus sp.]
MTEHLKENAHKSKRKKRESKDSRISRNELCKYISVFLLFVFVVWLTVFRSGSTKPFEEVSLAVQSSIFDEELVLKDSQALKKYYGLNSAEYEGVLFYTSEFSMSAKEVVLIKVKDETQVEQVKSAIEARIETRIDSFEGYAPEQVQMLKEAQYVVRGNYIFLAVTPDAEEYKTAFVRSL